MENSIYFNLNLNDDTEAAYTESKRFLDEYYSSDWPEWKVNVWTACGSPEVCAERIKAYEGVGAQTMIIRFASYDQKTQLKRFLAEVAPLL
jgi:alkanesulfonate monooxygenase SsuD/methylene tetrahydromethanopterin reductase-like flavin-dependent oxidoreductase (luciferase family)